MRNKHFVPDHVLVIARAGRPQIRRVIQEHGLQPIEASTFTETMARLRGRPFAAIVIDPRNAVLDPLEMVLTVRDFDRDMPILLLHGNRDDRVNAPLLAQPAFTVVPVGEIGRALQQLTFNMATADSATV